MKIFMCVVLSLAAVSAAPSEQSGRDKRGIFGEPGGLLSPHLHHDPIFGTHAHLPALHAPVLHAPSLLHAPLRSSYLHEPLHAPLHAPLHSSIHAPLHAPLLPSLHAAPLFSSSSLLHAPLAAPLHLDALHSAPLISSHSHIDTPILHGSHFDTLHTDIHHSAPLLSAPLHAPIIHHAPARIIKVIKTVHAPAPHIFKHGW